MARNAACYVTSCVSLIRRRRGELTNTWAVRVTKVSLVDVGVDGDVGGGGGGVVVVVDSLHACTQLATLARLFWQDNLLFAAPA